ncbi:MAG: hypothetical protein JWN20_251 [Jatrophihabitantaceae bacterium]|nr:hypothetical protein [Jatrophihabitantaceae bacterium]
MRGHEHDDPMTEATAELARIVLSEQPLEQMMLRISTLTKQVLPGATEVSVTLLGDGRPFTVALTGPLALDLDERQYEAGHGPCLHAARTGSECHVPNMAVETRWPSYSAGALEAGILSSLSIPLSARQARIGALNIYGAQPMAFDEPSTDIARTFAAHAAIAMGSARLMEASTPLAPTMKAAMQSRAIVEQARGILMVLRRVDADEAARILQELATSSCRPARDVAQGIIDNTGS